MIKIDYIPGDSGPNGKQVAGAYAQENVKAQSQFAHCPWLIKITSLNKGVLLSTYWFTGVCLFVVCCGFTLSRITYFAVNAAQ